MTTVSKQDYVVTPKVVTASRIGGRTAAHTAVVVLLGSTGSFTLVSLLLAMYIISSDGGMNDFLFSIMITGAIAIPLVFITLYRAIAGAISHSIQRKVCDALQSNLLVSEVTNDFGLTLSQTTEELAWFLMGDNRREYSIMKFSVVDDKPLDYLSLRSSISAELRSPVVVEYAFAA